MKALYSQTFFDHILDLVSLKERRPLLEETVRLIREHMEVNQASVVLVNLSQRQVLEVAGEHFSETTFDAVWDGIEGWVMREKQPTLTRDIVNDVRTTGHAMIALSRQPVRDHVAVAPCGDYGVVTAVGDNVSPINLHLLAALGQTLATALNNLGWNTPSEKVAVAQKDVYLKPMLLVGTTDLQAQVVRSLQQIEQNHIPMAFAIIAPAGYGKSAFAGWLTTQAKRQRFLAASAIASPYDSPYSLWRQTLINLYPELETLPVEEDSAHQFLAEKKSEWGLRARLLMELLTPGQTPTLESYSVEQKQAAIATLIADLVSDYKLPLVLILEDAQVMDEASRYVLERVVHHLAYQNTRIFLCVTSTTPSVLPDGMQRMELAPLKLEDVTLLRKSLVGDIEVDDAFLLERTGGSPLHLQLLLGNLAEKNLLQNPSELKNTSLPALVADIFNRVDGRIQKLLSGAAAITTPFTEAHPAAISPDVQVNIDTLSQPAQIFLKKLDNGKWMFRSSRYREIITGLTEDKQQIHEQLAAYLEQQHPTQAARIAYHYQMSTQPQFARNHLVQAAHMAHAAGAYQEALRYITQALELPGDLSNMDKFVILSEQADLYYALKNYPQQAQTLQKLSEVAREMDDAWLYADSGWRWLNHYLMTGQTTEGLATWKLFYDQAEKAYHTVARAEIHIATALLYQQAGQYSETQTHLDEAAAIASQTRKLSLGARILFTLGKGFEAASSYDMAQACFEQALEIYRQENDQVGVANCLTEMGKMYHDIGYSGSAQDYLEQAQQFWLEMGNAAEAIDSGLTLAELLIQQNRPVAAIENIMQLQPVVTRLADPMMQGRWWYLYGLACSAIQSYVQAIGCYTQALDSYPETAEKERIETTVQIAYACAQNRQPEPCQQWIEKVQDADLKKYVYSPMTYLNFASVTKRQAILETGQQPVREKADRIQDEKVRRYYLARPDRQKLFAFVPVN